MCECRAQWVLHPDAKLFVAGRSSDFFDPVALAQQYPDLDERALKLLESPNARYGDRGRVLSSMEPGNVGDRFNQQHTVLTPSKL